MASFEKAGSSLCDEEIQKFPLRRLEPSIQKFIKVLNIDLDRLHRHRLNIEKFNRLEDWVSLHREHVNASRTVQQIKANIREIEKSRRKVLDGDLQKFDEKVEEIKQHAVVSVMEFIDLSSGESPVRPPSPDMTQSVLHPKETDPLFSAPSPSQDDLVLVSQSLPPTFGMEQYQLHPLPELSEAAESWDQLQESLIELNTMVHQFATLVHDQKEQVDRIEDNIESAHAHVQQGTLQLGKASKYKAVLFPIAGALIGTVVAGPVGFVAGAKIGGVAGAVGGGVLGFASGKFMKKRQDNITEIELQNMSKQRSTSVPDVGSGTKNFSRFFSWKT